MLLTGSGSDRSLSSVVFVADGHPFCRAEGDFVPVSEDDPASCSLRDRGSYRSTSGLRSAPPKSK